MRASALPSVPMCTARTPFFAGQSNASRTASSAASCSPVSKEQSVRALRVRQHLLRVAPVVERGVVRREHLGQPEASRTRLRRVRAECRAGRLVEAFPHLFGQRLVERQQAMRALRRLPRCAQVPCLERPLHREREQHRSGMARMVLRDFAGRAVQCAELAGGLRHQICDVSCVVGSPPLEGRVHTVSPIDCTKAAWQPRTSPPRRFISALPGARACGTDFTHKLRTGRSCSVPTGAISHGRICERGEGSGAARRRKRPPGQPSATSLAPFEPSLHFVDVVHALDDDAAGRGGDFVLELMALSMVCGSMSFAPWWRRWVGNGGGASLRDAIRRPASGQPLPPAGPASR